MGEEGASPKSAGKKDTSSPKSPKSKKLGRDVSQTSFSTDFTEAYTGKMKPPKLPKGEALPSSVWMSSPKQSKKTSTSKDTVPLLDQPDVFLPTTGTLPRGPIAGGSSPDLSPGGQGSSPGGGSKSPGSKKSRGRGNSPSPTRRVMSARFYPDGSTQAEKPLPRTVQDCFRENREQRAAEAAGESPQYVWDDGETLTAAETAESKVVSLPPLIVTESVIPVHIAEKMLHDQKEKEELEKLSPEERAKKEEENRSKSPFRVAARYIGSQGFPADFKHYGAQVMRYGSSTIYVKHPDIPKDLGEPDDGLVKPWVPGNLVVKASQATMSPKNKKGALPPLDEMSPGGGKKGSSPKGKGGSPSSGKGSPSSGKGSQSPPGGKGSPKGAGKGAVSPAAKGGQPMGALEGKQMQDALSATDLARSFFGVKKTDSPKSGSPKEAEKSGSNWWNSSKVPPKVAPKLGMLAAFFMAKLPQISEKLPKELGIILAGLSSDILSEEENKDLFGKVRMLADGIRRLARKEKNVDMRILSLILKLTCTLNMKKADLLAPENVKMAKCITALVREVADERNVKETDGEKHVFISPHCVGLLAELAVETRKRGGAGQPAAVLAPETREALQDLSNEIKAKCEDFCGADLYMKSWKKKIDKVFEKMDKSGTGFVSRAELRQCYNEEVVKQSTRKYLVEKFMNAVDEDGDDRISYDEWICYIGEAERSGEYTIEELSFELSMFLRGKGASKVAGL